MELTFESVKAAVREALLEELCIGSYEIANKWHGGRMLLEPHDKTMQSKEIPLEMFFKKVTSVREKLRVIEQKINNNPKLDPEDKLDIQQQITRAYGSLTTFNILFKNERDKFSGVKD